MECKKQHVEYAECRRCGGEIQRIVPKDNQHPYGNNWWVHVHSLEQKCTGYGEPK